MKLDNRTKTLIGIGASVTANCEPCLQHHVSIAKKNGVNDQDISEAISLGQAMRKGIAERMDKFIAQLNYSVPIAGGPNTGSCCG